MHVSPALVVFWGVILTRFVLPLWIPRFPLPAIAGCLVVDALDQSIFQAFTRVDLSGYQGYDKALDIFYLSIAMLSIYRNWSIHAAAQIGRVLFYLRLIGVVAFELTHWRPMLFLLPNAFEYYFIFYEVVRCRWSPRKLSKREYLGAAAVIWILKLPQEYWIHIARLDFTDVLKGHVLHAEEMGWLSAIRHSPVSFAVMLAAFGALVILARMAIRHFAGPPEHALRLAAPPLPETIDEAPERDRAVATSWRLFDVHLVEKIVLAGFVTVIFAQIVPGWDTGPPKLVLGTGIIVVINAFLGLRRARRAASPESGIGLFVVVVLTNVTVAGIAEALLRIRGGNGLDMAPTVFFLVLLTLVVTLYDRWRPVFDVRFAKRRSVRGGAKR